MSKLSFSYRTNIKCAAENLFQWHSKKTAFKRLFPSYLRSKLIHIKGDFSKQEVLFKVFNFGIPITWKAQHTEYINNKKFTDIQVKGPFKFWKHEHIFEKKEADECTLLDQIEYRLPFSFISHKLFKKFFHSTLEKQFKFRASRLKSELNILTQFSQKPLKILISGASGLVGSQLSDFLIAAGHTVTPLKRTVENSTDSVLNYKTAEARNLEGFDVIIHLAGEPVVGLWTRKKKQEIYNSRVLSTQFLCKQIQSLKKPPQLLLTASAIGYYPESNEGQAFNENAPLGSSFLSKVVNDWEKATESLKQCPNIRVVHARLGLVFHPQGGSLLPLLLSTQLGLAHIFGKGNNIWSWVSLDDVLYSFYHIIHTKSLVGPVNIVSPQPASQKETIQTLAKQLKRPCFLKVPTFLVKGLLGEMGQNLILANQKIVPQKLLDSQYRFMHSNLEECFEFYL